MPVEARKGKGVLVAELENKESVGGGREGFRKIGSLMVRLHSKTEGEKENCVTPLVHAGRAPCLRRALQDHPISSGTAVLPLGA